MPSVCQSLQAPEEACSSAVWDGRGLTWPCGVLTGLSLGLCSPFLSRSQSCRMPLWTGLEKVLQNPRSRCSLPVLCLLVMLQECGPTASTPWWLSLALMRGVFQALLGAAPPLMLARCCPPAAWSEPGSELETLPTGQAEGKGRRILVCSTLQNCCHSWPSPGTAQDV